MTTEERLNRIEHLTAGLAEERRKDREEYKTLWRDTQRQIDSLARHVDEFAAENRAGMAELRTELRQRVAELPEQDKRLGQRIAELAEQGKRTDQRISDLVSAFGEMMTRIPPR